MKKLLVTALALLSLAAPSAADEQILEQRGYGTWSFLSTRADDSYIHCTAASTWGGTDTLFYYEAVGGDLIEDLVFFDPYLQFGQATSFTLTLYSDHSLEDGASYTQHPLEFRQVGGTIRAHMSDELFRWVIDSGAFDVSIDDVTVAQGYIYPDAFRAVRACQASAAIIEGMGPGEEI